MTADDQNDTVEMRMLNIDTIPFFQQLPKENQRRIANDLQMMKYELGANIITEGEFGDEFFIIDSGEVTVRKNDRNGLTIIVSRLGKGAFFGGVALVGDGLRTASVDASTPVTCLVLTRKAFAEQIYHLPDVLDIIKTRLPQQVFYSSPPSISVGTKTSLPHTIQSFIGIRDGPTVGCGTFGRVRLVREKGSNKVYAAKCLKKFMVDDVGQREHTINERSCLMELDHPFIVSLLTTFQDPCRLYMIMELVQGGELYNMILSRGGLGVHMTRFYAAQIVLSLEACHDKQYIYRDLKPENVLVGSDGYLKLADFGLSKKVPNGSSTYTLCGSPGYMAPEIFTCRGHDHSVDWWALGCLLYEMLFGIPPFDDDTAVAAHGRDKPITFPQTCGKDAADLISKLLVPNPKLRLGCLIDGVAGIKHHPFFGEIDWQALVAKRIEPPYFPSVLGHDDISNFTDEYPDSEDDDDPTIVDPEWDDIDF